jgi:hypothetical protein
MMPTIFTIKLLSFHSQAPGNNDQTLKTLVLIVSYNRFTVSFFCAVVGIPASYLVVLEFESQPGDFLH